ncbi:concanavalin A-like lectin/glucanase [Leptospira idonii]|uniref:concanavalin A-like lectin/glucanase n=1 Tax=Leptospira idonii TaxID=1193500 RepID=UPI00319D9BBB
MFLFLALPLSAKEITRLTTSSLTDWKRIDAVLESHPGKKDIIRTKQNIPKSGELFLDFEGEVSQPEESESPLIAKAKSLSVLSSSYIIDQKNSFYGKKSAYFSGKRNQIHLSVSGSSLFGPNPESFSITVPILINEQGATSTILDRTVFIKGKKYGFSLELEENKPVFYVNNLIHLNNGNTTSAEIRSTTSIPRKEWQIISILFDTDENRFVLFQNGYEKAKFEANGSEVTGIGFPEYDSSNLILAKSFFGNMDGLHIHKGEPYPSKGYTKFPKVQYSDETKLASHNGSWVISPVYSTEFSHSALLSYEALFEQPKDTSVAVYFRGDNRKFADSSKDEPKWIRLEDPKKLPSDLPKFRFHQWKVWLRSDPEGNNSPSFHSFRYQTQELTPPDVPTGFRVAEFSSSERKICFSWNSNHEKEVRDKGGYMIHYGVEPNRMIGTLFVKKAQNGSFAAIDGNETGSDYKNLKYCADEDSLISNFYIPEAEKTPQGTEDPRFSSHHERRGSLFQSGITYYFKISAYNHKHDEWEGRDQRSKLSSPISVHFPKEISER